MTSQFSPRSSQTIGARVLSSQGEVAPVAAFSSKGKDNSPDTAGILLVDGSGKPCGGGRRAGSIGPWFESEAVDG